MRKVVAAEFLSLDGVMESPDQWHFPYFNDEMGQAVLEVSERRTPCSWAGSSTRNGRPSGRTRTRRRTPWPRP